MPDLQKELVVDDLRIHNQTYYHYPGQIWNPVWKFTNEIKIAYFSWIKLGENFSWGKTNPKRSLAAFDDIICIQSIYRLKLSKIKNKVPLDGSFNFQSEVLINRPPRRINGRNRRDSRVRAATIWEVFIKP